MADIVRDVFAALVRVHLLHHASEQPIYGLAMIEELARHGYRLSPGTLYPIFRGLEEAGFLRSEPVVVSGKVRKYYRITAAGRRALEGFKAKIRELVGEVLYGDQLPAANAKKRKTARR
ncbi:MAG TPA: PadR family transcriptional regulator [Burkholderiales bacterium]|nr:PadR family transcriptional regulator [Burkholderiales bacterium]